MVDIRLVVLSLRREAALLAADLMGRSKIKDQSLSTSIIYSFSSFTKKMFRTTFEIEQIDKLGFTSASKPLAIKILQFRCGVLVKEYTIQGFKMARWLESTSNFFNHLLVLEEVAARHVVVGELRDQKYLFFKLISIVIERKLTNTTLCQYLQPSSCNLFPRPSNTYKNYVYLPALLCDNICNYSSSCSVLHNDSTILPAPSKTFYQEKRLFPHFYTHVGSQRQVTYQHDFVTVSATIHHLAVLRIMILQNKLLGKVRVDLVTVWAFSETIEVGNVIRQCFREPTTE